MLETIPRYKKFILHPDDVINSLNMQVMAKFKAKTINWPDEPWEAKGQGRRDRRPRRKPNTDQRAGRIRR